MEKILAVVLGCMSAAILLAEATLLTNGVDLSLFSILIKSVGNDEVLVQVYNQNTLPTFSEHYHIFIFLRIVKPIVSRVQQFDKFIIHVVWQYFT